MTFFLQKKINFFKGVRKYWQAKIELAKGQSITYNKVMLNFTSTTLPWIWLIIVVVASIIEAFTLSLTAIWFSLSALLLIFISMTGIPLAFQLFIFALLSLILLIFTKPLVIKYLRSEKTPTNADSLIGQKCMLSKSISQIEKGCVQIKDITWNAVSIDDSPIEKGSFCIIKEIRGNTLIVEKEKSL